MTENSTLIPNIATFSPRRLAINTEDSGTSRLPAILTLSADDAGICTFNIARADDSFLTEIKEHLFNTVTSVLSDRDALRRPLSDDEVTRLWGAIDTTLRVKGYTIEQLPDGDQKLEFSIDLTTGRVVGRTEALHSAVALNADLARKVAKSLGGAFQAMSRDYIRSIRDALSQGDNTEAIVILRNAQKEGIFSFGKPSEDLLNVLLEIDADTLSAEDRRLLREFRLAVSERRKRFDVSGLEARALLNEFDGDLSPEWKIAVTTTLGLSELHSGHFEAAMAIWRSIVNSGVSIDAPNRAWLYRNMSLAVPTSDPDAWKYARLSADSFLEAGLKDDAVASTMRAVDCLLFVEPSKAISLLGEMIGWFGQDRLVDEDRKAQILLILARKNIQLHRYADALIDAEAAIPLCERNIGQESILIGAFHVAAIAAKFNDKSELAKIYTEKAEKLTSEIGEPHFTLAEQVAKLLEEYNSDFARQILRDAEIAGNKAIVDAVNVCIAHYDDSLDVPSRLSRLEEVLIGLNNAGEDGPAKESVHIALGLQLSAIGDDLGALRWYEKVLVGNPLNGFAEKQVLSLYEKLEAWPKAIELLREQLRRFGYSPNRMLYLGKCLLDCGRVSEAIEPLQHVKKEPSTPDNLLEVVDKLLLRALDLGASPVVPTLENNLARLAVLREELDAEFDKLAIAIEANVRMSFWRSVDAGSKKWTESPEKLAQDFVKVFFKARFGDRIEIYEEVAVGAGRCDLFLSFSGGLSVILELKMCGSPYSSTYAFSGADQITHYMINREKKLGYLLIFDARTRDYGKGIEPITNIADCMVVTKFIDVRHTVRAALGSCGD